jgi:hypothetical protein
MQKLATDWRTAESIGENKLIWKQEIAKKLACAKIQQNKRTAFTL